MELYGRYGIGWNEDWDGGWRDPSDWTGDEWVGIRGDTVALANPAQGVLENFLLGVVRDCVEGGSEPNFASQPDIDWTKTRTVDIEEYGF